MGSGAVAFDGVPAFVLILVVESILALFSIQSSGEGGECHRVAVSDSRGTDFGDIDRFSGCCGRGDDFGNGIGIDNR